MADLIATYGPYILGLIFTALTALVGKYLIARLKAGYALDVAQRAWTEVKGSVLEVAQTYSAAIKAARSDGTLTEAEKAAAKQAAIDIAKANIGKAGLAKLGRVLGVDVDSWLASKTEQAIAVIKTTTPGRSPLVSSAPPIPR